MSVTDRLPALREDLRILPSAPLPGGAPAWVVLDPVRHRYFQISRSVLDLLSVWSAGTREAVKAEVKRNVSRHVTDGEIDGVLAFLSAHELTRDPLGGSAALARRERSRRHHWLAWLVHNYLFFKVPLLRPQAWLDRNYALARSLFSRPVLLASALAGVAALFLIIRQWDHFAATAVSFFTLQGLALYGVSLVAVKSLHELGHALMATRYRIRVPSIGVAFMVMAPFLYSDVSDSWRLRSRKQRLAIDAAGMLAEFMLASWALLLWVFLPDGMLRSIAFVTGTTSLVLSLLLNLNPFMRFDGYHILADSTGIPNLQTRAMAVGRWLLREVLFGLRAPPPENFTPRVLGIIALYAYAIWIYRFFLFLGIAILVYHATFKALGVILFMIEIVWFIARPVAMEMGVVWKGRNLVMRQTRTWVTLAIFCGGIAAMLIPWSTRVHFPAVAGAMIDTAVYPRSAGQVTEVTIRDGALVQAGQVLVVLQSPLLDSELTRTRLKINLLELRRNRATSDASDRADFLVLGQQLQAERQHESSLLAQKDELTIRAPVDGTIREFDPYLQVGSWVSTKNLILRIVGRDRSDIRGYIPEADITRVQSGALGRFVPDDPQFSAQPVALAMIGRSAVEELDLEILASVHEGPLAVVPEGRKLKPTSAIYPVSLSTDGVPPHSMIRGTVILEGRSESYAVRIMRQILSVLIRESGA